MRELVILKLLEVLAEQGYVGVPDFLTFPAPTTEADIRACTDEQLVELLYTSGMFEG